jgi:DNA-binding IclR family transcriptional regulator
MKTNRNISGKINSNRNQKKYHVRSVERALGVLKTFLDCDEEQSVTEISEKAGLDISTTFRLLVTLQSNGFVEYNNATAKYRLGVSCLELGSKFIKNNDIRKVALKQMEALRNEFGETVHLTILDGIEVVYLEKLSGLHPIGFMSSRVGGRAPAYCTGVGKAHLAYLPEEEIYKRFEGKKLFKYTKNTITNIKLLIEELERVRERGFSFDNEEHEIGVKCVAVPIFDHNGVVAAMSISGPVDRMNSHINQNPGGLIEKLKEAARSVSLQIGGRELVQEYGK